MKPGQEIHNLHNLHNSHYKHSYIRNKLTSFIDVR